MKKMDDQVFLSTNQVSNMAAWSEIFNFDALPTDPASVLHHGQVRNTGNVQSDFQSDACWWSKRGPSRNKSFSNEENVREFPLMSENSGRK